MNFACVNRAPMIAVARGDTAVGDAITGEDMPGSFKTRCNTVIVPGRPREGQDDGPDKSRPEPKASVTVVKPSLTLSVRKMHFVANRSTYRHAVGENVAGSWPVNSTVPVPMVGVVTSFVPRFSSRKLMPKPSFSTS